MKRNITITMIVVSLVIIGFGSFNIMITPSVRAHSGDEVESKFINDSPKIDGVINSNEWESAKQISIISQGYGYIGASTETREINIYVLNNAESLFIAVEIIGEEQDEDDYLVICFDEPHDGIYNDGEDTKTVSNDQYYDSNQRPEWESGSEDDIVQGGTFDGDGKLKYNSVTDKYVAEFKIPLDSGDELDIQAKMGDTMGFNVLFIDQLFSDNPIGYGWPSENADDSAGWADLKIAKSSDVSPGDRSAKSEKDDDNFTILLILGFIIIIVIVVIAIILVRIRRKKQTARIPTQYNQDNSYPTTYQDQYQAPVSNPPQPQPNLCSICNQPLTFYPQNNKYYCHQCKKYV